MLIRYNYFLQYLFLFFIGGFTYGAIEILSRGYSHISMMIAGGICFILIGLINKLSDIGFIGKMAISVVIITVVEFVTGIIVNVWLNLNVWDYSDLPLNLMGQICIYYSLIWFILSALALKLDKYLRAYLRLP
ncbi:MAG: hypothetical protein GX379_09910 [Clostridiales bacterium]|jgi:uncharacterized membrane protein|nr:hypothetical protein [Clostridiales bacterium]